MRRPLALLLVASASLAVWPPGGAGATVVDQLVPMERVSVADDETPLTGDSTTPEVTPDGRFVAFANAGDVTFPVGSQVLVRDRELGTTTSLGPGLRPFGISDDGRVVGVQRGGVAVVLDREGDEHVVGDGTASHLSPDGCEVVLQDGTVHDWCAGTTEVIELDPAPYPHTALTLSRTGRFVVYRSEALELVRFDRETGESLVVGPGSNPSISDDGSTLLHQRVTRTGPGTLPNLHEIVVADLSAGTEQVVWVEDMATEYNGRPLHLSPDGRRAVFAAFDRTIPSVTVAGLRLLDVATGTSEWAVVEDAGPVDSPAGPTLTDAGLLVFHSRSVRHDLLHEGPELADCWATGLCDHDVFALPVEG